MSHFTRVTTQLRDMVILQQALEQLGYDVAGAGPIRGYGGQQVNADLVIDTGSSYDIGFLQEDDQIELIADFWGLKVDREKFLNQVIQRYAYLTVVEQAQAQGWSTLTEEVQPDGSIRLVMQRWK